MNEVFRGMSPTWNGKRPLLPRPPGFLAPASKDGAASTLGEGEGRGRRQRRE